MSSIILYILIFIAGMIVGMACLLFGAWFYGRKLKTGSGVFSIPEGVDTVRVSMRGGGGGSSGMDIDMKTKPKKTGYS